MNKGFEKWLSIGEEVENYFKNINEKNCDNCRYDPEEPQGDKDVERCNDECFAFNKWEEK